MPGNSGHWTDADLRILLSVINLNIASIRSVTQSDQKKGLQKGLQHASELISGEIGNHCTLARAETKIRELWKVCGRNDGAAQPYDVCMYGATPVTLPGISPEMHASAALGMTELQR